MWLSVYKIDLFEGFPTGTLHLVRRLDVMKTRCALSPISDYNRDSPHMIIHENVAL